LKIGFDSSSASSISTSVAGGVYMLCITVWVGGCFGCGFGGGGGT
jgi:hypothetical protein